MKLSWGFVASSLYCSAAAARPHVDPETARLIIAQRLGLSRFHSIEHADAETLGHINTFGGQQQRLFGGDVADRSRAHLLMWIENAEQDQATVIVNDGSDHTQDFVVSNPPSTSDNERLIRDLLLQAESLPEYPDPQKRTYTSSFEIEATLPSKEQLTLYNGYLSVFRVGQKDEYGSQELAKVMSKVNRKAATLGFSTTTVMMPASRTHSKRAANPWGAYQLPSKEARREPLNAQASLASTPLSSPNLGDSPAMISAEDQNPVRGILPSCFDSMVTCQRQTHNCSSHGQCTLLHKGRGSGSNKESVDCYGCACKPTVEHVGEDKGMESKRKVTYWGGPACQKKDISVQFWLFVGTGVILAFLVASGIGMLYSMGSEELPSVIGAGVSGPVRK